MKHATRRVDVRRLTLRQYMTAFTSPPLYQVRDLVAKSGLPQPRASEVLRGMRIYPAGLARVRRAIGLSESPADVELFDRLLENSAAEAGRGGSP